MFSKEFIDDWVEKQMPDFLKDLITITNIKSVAEFDSEVKPYGKGCRDVLGCMLKIGRNYGFNTKNYDNYVGCIELNDLDDDIGIWAHLDVVDEGTGWVYPPYDAQVKDGYVIGRGCQDNKSSAVIGLYAMRFLKEFNVPVKHNVKLFLGTCEEQGMYDLDYFVKNYPCPGLSLVPDSGFPVCLGERGSFNGDLISSDTFSEAIIDFHTSASPYMTPDSASITLVPYIGFSSKLAALPDYIHTSRDGHGNYILSATGVSKNASMPHGCDDALMKLLCALDECHILNEHDNRIFKLCREINRTYDGSALGIRCDDEVSGPLVLTCVNARLDITSDTGFNPEEDTGYDPDFKTGKHLKLSFVCKFPVTKNNMDFEKLTRKACKKNGYELSLVSRYNKATYFDLSNPVVSKLTGIYNDYMGLDTKPFVMSGGTYARKLPNAFAFGTGMKLPKPPEGLFLPGHGDYHQPDEAIAIMRMQKALAIYILSLIAIT